MIYTTITDAINAEILPALGEHTTTHDIDAIADEVITTTGHGTTAFGYTLGVDTDEFWAIVENNAL